MDQIKIGKFIAECRKKENLTQSALAGKLNITDRAISKWETGRGLPDASIMLELCNILKITVNDLLSGEVILMENYEQELEKNLLEMVKQKEKLDKQLLKTEVVVGVSSMIVFFILMIIASYVKMEEWLRIVLIIIGLLPIVSVCPLMLRIEQIAGYYECKKCKHKYVPTYKAVNIAMHIGRTRYLKCPKCGKKSWNKKVLK